MNGWATGRPSRFILPSGLRKAKDYLLRNYITVVFVVYAAVFTIAAFHHEPWMDEAQAWLLAKDASLAEIFLKYLKYEGTPGLWHLLIYLPAKLGLPFWSIHVIAVICSATGVYLFLRNAPFPPFIKALYPFTFFALFQYGVIARSYSLLPAVLFLVAIHYRRRMEQPLLYLLLVFALANISAHTFLLAATLVLLHAFDVLYHWRLLAKPLRIKHLAGMGFYGILTLLMAYLLAPPPDHMLIRSSNTSIWHILNVGIEMIMGSLTYNPYSALPDLQFVLAGLVFIVTLIWLKQQQKRRMYVLPLLLLCLLFGIKYKNLWHQGILFYLWVFVLWISYRDQLPGFKPQLKRAMGVVLVFVFGVHVYWGLSAVVYEIGNSYSAGREVAKYIRGNKLEHKKIFVSGWKCTSILPYFDRNIFYNFNNGSQQRFWNWCDTNRTALGAGLAVMDTIAAQKPDVVIIASHYIPRQKIIALDGYRPQKFFRGFLFWKTTRTEPECYAVFRRIELPPKAGP